MDVYSGQVISTCLLGGHYRKFHYIGDSTVQCRALSGLTVTVISNLPAGAGLGSSAAYSVCLAAGFLSDAELISNQPPASAHRTNSSAEDDTLKQVQARMREAGVELGIGADEFVWCERDLELINRWGFEAEKLIHGTPSGIDNSISTYGR